MPKIADIVALGDSQIYGTGVFASEAWPRQLEDLSHMVVYSKGVFPSLKNIDTNQIEIVMRKEEDQAIAELEANNNDQELLNVDQEPEKPQKQKVEKKRKNKWNFSAKKMASGMIKHSRLCQVGRKTIATVYRYLKRNHMDNGFWKKAVSIAQENLIFTKYLLMRIVELSLPLHVGFRSWIWMNVFVKDSVFAMKPFA